MPTLVTVRDDEMMLGIDGALHVVADSVGAVALRGHRSRVGISQGDLRLTRGDHLSLDRCQTAELRLERLDALRKPRNLAGGHRNASDLLLAIRAVELLEIALDGALDGCNPFRQSVFGEILLAMVHGLELAAVNRDGVAVEQMQVPAERDEARADLADSWAIVAATIGDRLEVGRQLADEPHHLDIASGTHAPIDATTEPG